MVKSHNVGKTMPSALSPSHHHFYRWYLFHSQIRVVYGIVFPTLMTINNGIIPPFIVYVPMCSQFSQVMGGLCQTIITPCSAVHLQQSHGDQRRSEQRHAQHEGQAAQQAAVRARPTTLPEADAWQLIGHV